MQFTQYYLECLSHASYLIGDDTTGRAVVVDPQRDVDGYVTDAAALGLRIERVIETHFHADFLSGHLELAARTGAVISYGDAAAGSVEFAVDLLAPGTRLSLGDVTLEIRATPGHTPESICIVTYEHADDAVPYGVCTGDTLFIGDVGRPDLLSSLGHTADDLARSLYHSLHEQLLTLPDATRVFPAHGAGSACGKQLSTETQSTIGEQRRVNYALQPMTEEEFVASVTEGQPLRPAYFLFDAIRNRQPHALLDTSPPAALTLDDVLGRAATGAALLDARSPMDFASGHLQGALNVGLEGRFSEYVGDIVDADRDVVLVGDPATAPEAKVRLGRIGFDHVVGYLADPAAAVAVAPDRFEPASRLTVEALAERTGTVTGLQLVDVRNPGETATGTIRGATTIPVASLVERVGELDPARPTVVYCAGGYRSSLAASLLRTHGFDDVSDLLGGFGAWRNAGLPVAAAESDDGQPVPFRPVNELDPVSAAAAVDEGAVLLDVREPDEWAAGHAPGATWVPMGQIPSRIDELPRDRRIVAVCRAGGRSARVAEALIAQGFDVANLTGGMQAWDTAGLPVLTDDGGAGAVI